MNSAVLVFCFCAAVSARLVSYQQNYIYTYGKDNVFARANDNENENGDEGEEVPARPPTSFSCNGKIDGYYADVETNCEAFHYCQTWTFPGGRNKTVDWTFECPETTVFNQELLTCTPLNESLNCQDSPNHFDVNQNLTQPTNPSQQKPNPGNATQISVTSPYFLYSVF